MNFFAAPRESYPREWKQVDSLLNKGLTESALKKVEQIYAKATKANNADQMVKALLFRLNLLEFREENAEVKQLVLLDSQLVTAPPVVKPILHSLLASGYWQYYQQNRWQFGQRTEVAGAAGETNRDVATWTLARLVAEARKHYLASLQEPEKLKAVPINTYHEVLGAGASQKEADLAKLRHRDLRPTLYDLLAHRAVDFMMNTEPEITQPAYKFQVDDAQYLAPAADFVKLTIASRDTTGLKLAAMHLLQDLLRYHLATGNLAALADADLKRIALVYQHAVFADKGEQYLAALAAARSAYAKTAIAADFAQLEAAYYQVLGDGFILGAPQLPAIRFGRQKAKQLAQKVIADFPNTQGATNAQALIQELDQKNLSLKVEAVLAPGQPALVSVEFRNLKKLWLKALPVTRADVESIAESYQERPARLQALALKPGKTWEQPTPDDQADLQSHRFETKMPALGLGQHLLLACDQADFKGTLAYAFFQVSSFSYQQRHDSGTAEIYVTDRTTGHPQANVTVNLYKQEYNSNTRRYDRKLARTGTTNADGYLRVSPDPERAERYYSEYFYPELVRGQDRLWGDNASLYLQRYDQATPSSRVRVSFFTDRAIYRPGQTIYFKGIALQDSTDGQHRILPKYGVAVELVDANGQTVATQNLTTNEYGSVAGSFVAPTSGLTGAMTLRASAGGQQQILVEEYKRPKFEVKFEPLKGSYRLGERVSVEGLAQAYSGANVDGATVTYRVMRRARFPRWWWWGDAADNSAAMEILSGTTQTGADGRFKVEFTAIPDPKLPAEGKPVFTYEVSADVTDLNGETRSGSRAVSVGYQALELAADLPTLLNAEQAPAQFTLNATNLDGQPEPAQGTWTLHRLRAPERAFRARPWARPDLFALTKADFYAAFPHDAHGNEDRLEEWPRETKLFEQAFDTEKSQELALGKLAPGAYVLELTSNDRFGQPVTARQFVQVFSEKAEQPALPAIHFQVGLEAGLLEPGQTARLLLATSLTDVRLLYEVEHQGQVVKAEWLKLDNQQRVIALPIEEKHRGNVAVQVTMVRNGRFYTQGQLVQVPYTNRQLDITFETFRDKLQPGQAEEWRLKIKGKKGDQVAAELLATLYDASLDAFRPHSFQFNILRQFGWWRTWTGQGFGSHNSSLASRWDAPRPQRAARSYDQLFDFGVFNASFGGNYYLTGGNGGRRPRDGRVRSENMAVMAAPAVLQESAQADAGLTEEENPAAGVAKKSKAEGGDELARLAPKPEPSPQGGGAGGPLDEVKARTNFSETAFFYPQLHTDAEGNVLVKFTVPEALTRWKMLGFAHTADLKYGFAQNQLVTQKDLMVVPNPPRFFRESDQMVFSAKITNLSDRDLDGTAKIFFFDALTMQPVDAQMYPAPVEAMSMETLVAQRSTKTFTVKKGQSTAVDWAIQIPDGTVQALTYRVVAQAGSFTDGEEMTLPVLTNRMLVTETLPLPIRGGQRKTYELSKLTASGQSTTLRHQSLTLEFTPNPTWYAVQALPYMMEYPYECAEQLFSRFYANSLATHIVEKQPTIKNVFEAWQKAPAGGALTSNLEKNQELKALLIEETPWLRNARDESERKRNVALLFDLVRMSTELDRALTKLEKMQLSNGGFPWFPDMPDSPWITQHIAAGLGHLDKLGVLDLRPGAVAATTSVLAKNQGRAWQMASQAVNYTDERIRENYEELLRLAKKGQIKLEEPHIHYQHYHYLYMRSFYPEIPVAARNQSAYQYFMGQAEKYWLQNGLYAQGMAALVFHRGGKAKLATDIVKSLRERALTSDELGMYWKNQMNRSYWWYEQPIETQALMIEVFGEVAQDPAAVDGLKAWLLKQKQTQDWKTTKATSEACYALLLQGDNWLASNELPEIKLGNQTVDPRQRPDLQVEPGTGYFKTTWHRSEVTPDLGKVTIEKKQPGVAWGGLYWQYFEQLDKITPAETPLKLKKQLFKQENTPTGPVLKALAEGAPLKVGDLVKVRIELRVDRALEYVHLKDMRAAGFEPVNVLSQYKWQDGLGYYESTRDAATNFFFGWLPQGTWVFEYPLRANQAGEFSNGITSIQCMYAPEFASHSEGVRVTIER
ncbi:MAG: MG2 domain-containing protein [Bernardetiaceae bacterium]|nr:MG2 domain-containing protein [Bernardetiaceae bacterium]